LAAHDDSLLNLVFNSPRTIFRWLRDHERWSHHYAGIASEVIDKTHIVLLLQHDFGPHLDNLIIRPNKEHFCTFFMAILSTKGVPDNSILFLLENCCVTNRNHFFEGARNEESIFSHNAFPPRGLVQHNDGLQAPHRRSLLNTFRSFFENLRSDPLRSNLDSYQPCESVD